MTTSQPQGLTVMIVYGHFVLEHVIFSTCLVTVASSRSLAVMIDSGEQLKCNALGQSAIKAPPYPVSNIFCLIKVVLLIYSWIFSPHRVRREWCRVWRIRCTAWQMATPSPSRKYREWRHSTEKPARSKVESLSMNICSLLVTNSPILSS